MKKKLQALLFLAACFAIVSFFPGTSHALLIRQPDMEKAEISQDDAIKIANDAFHKARYDIRQPQISETKATLVYNNSDMKNQWIVSHIVQDAVEPYFVTVIDAVEGSVISAGNPNFFELYDQWELERQTPNLFWSFEDLILFDELYRHSDLFPRHVMPTKADISKESAIEIAKKTLKREYGVSDEQLSQYKCSATIKLHPDNTRQWYICFCTIVSATQANVRYQVTINAADGSIILYVQN